MLFIQLKKLFTNLFRGDFIQSEELQYFLYANTSKIRVDRRLSSRWLKTSGGFAAHTKEKRKTKVRK
jgi:hypothetical protein